MKAEFYSIQRVLRGRNVSALIVLACTGPAGCGSDATNGAPTHRASKGAIVPVASAAAPSHESTSTGGDAGEPPLSDWATLITGDWAFNPGIEGYTCVRKTIAEDLDVNTFEGITPTGTHHALLTMGPTDGPDGVTSCSAADFKTQEVFGSGVGTDTFHLPPGIAVRIPKGTQLLLNLHLFNTSPDPLSGTSGVRVRTIPASGVKQSAEGFFAGTVAINLPPMKKSTTVGGCLMSEDATLLAVAPHMHLLGTYMKVTAQSSLEGDVVIHDAPYDFNEQSLVPIQPLRMARGDNVRVECTHTNSTDTTVTYGSSTRSEMCFAVLYRYPATSDLFMCTNGPGEASH